MQGKVGMGRTGADVMNKWRETPPDPDNILFCIYHPSVLTLKLPFKKIYYTDEKVIAVSDSEF